MKDSFKEYQKKANGFINVKRYKPLDTPEGILDYLNNGSLGLAGDTGEFVDWVKKAQYHGLEFFSRNKNGELMAEVLPEVAEQLIEELGGILWYVAQCCLALDVSMDYVARKNIEKLSNRHGGAAFDEEKGNAKDYAKLRTDEEKKADREREAALRLPPPSPSGITIPAPPEGTVRLREFARQNIPKGYEELTDKATIEKHDLIWDVVEDKFLEAEDYDFGAKAGSYVMVVRKPNGKEK